VVVYQIGFLVAPRENEKTGGEELYAKGDISLSGKDIAFA
jgi:hypothetical protein